MGCHYLTWLAAVLVSLDSATQDQFLLLEFLAFHKAQPSRDILRINFAVLVETVYVALLPDNVLNDSGLFPKTQLKTLLSQISSGSTWTYLMHSIFDSIFPVVNVSSSPLFE